MKRRILSFLLFTMLSIFVFNSASAQNNALKTEGTIFVFGGDVNLKFVQYVADLTIKESTLLEGGLEKPL